MPGSWLELKAALASEGRVTGAGPLERGQCLYTGELCLFLSPVARPERALSATWVTTLSPGDRTVRLDTAEAGLDLSPDPSVCKEESRGERVEEERGGLKQRGWIEGGGTVEEGRKGEEEGGEGEGQQAEKRIRPQRKTSPIPSSCLCSAHPTDLHLDPPSSSGPQEMLTLSFCPKVPLSLPFGLVS